MRSLKKLVLTGAVTGMAICTMTICSNAATVKVTAETLNVRKGPSTTAEVVAMLSEGVECELLGEEDNWYKVKYKNYTGYVSKDYAKLIGDNNENQTNNQNTQTGNDNNLDSNPEQENNSQEENNTQTNQNNNSQENSNDEDEITITYKKFNKNTDVKLLPLIHSSKIGSMKSGTQVIFITETSGWSYVQTDSISGWVRSDTLSEGKVVTGSSSQNNTGKTAYVNESRVNLRTGAGTNNSIIKVVTLNTEVTIIQDEGEWCKVKAGDDTGYILKEYLSSSKTVTSRNSAVSRIEETEKVAETTSKQENNNETTTKKESTNTSNKTSTTATKTNTNTATNTTSSDKKESNTSVESKNSSTTNNKTETESNKTKGTDIVAYAQKYLGYKYVYGGDGSNNTFDCSGFTMYVFKHFGINLAHGANAQYNSGKGKKISKQSDLQVGDIVFLTDYETGKGIGHCGIYLGNGNFIHASTTTYTVTISSLNTMYKGRFYAGLRLI